MRILLRSAKLLLLVQCFVPHGALAQDGPLDRQLDFAHALVAEGEYYRAITEFKRVLFHSSQNQVEQRAEAILGVGQALHSGFEFGRSGEWLHQHTYDLTLAGRLNDGVNLMSKSFLDANAGRRLLEILEEKTVPARYAQLYEPLALANLGRWSEAEKLFASMPAENPFKSVADSHALLAHRAVESSWRSPKTAGWLGAIPGLGYLYAGHKQTAISSLIINAVFGAATFQAFDSDQDVLGGFLALFSLSWYGSNIYGSVQAARRYNQKLQRDLWSELEY